MLGIAVGPIRMILAVIVRESAVESRVVENPIQFKKTSDNKARGFNSTTLVESMDYFALESMAAVEIEEKPYIDRPESDTTGEQTKLIKSTGG